MNRQFPDVVHPKYVPGTCPLWALEYLWTNCGKKRPLCAAALKCGVVVFVYVDDVLDGFELRPNPKVAWEAARAFFRMDPDPAANATDDDKRSF